MQPQLWKLFEINKHKVMMMVTMMMWYKDTYHDCKDMKKGLDIHNPSGATLLWCNACDGCYIKEEH